MAGLTTNNFLDTAVAVARVVLRAPSRAAIRDNRQFLGRSDAPVLYVLLPVSIIVALVFVVLGAPQTLQGALEATTLEGARQTIALGPVASQEAIKLLGDNGGGFFNANSGHPFENPSAVSNTVGVLEQAGFPVALVFAFGRMVGDRRQRRSLFAAMTLIFIASVIILYRAEAGGNPQLTELGVDPVGGNLEGKDLRFSQAAAHCSRSRRQEPEPAPPMRLSSCSRRSAGWFRCSIC